jgi:Uri superfamily endonuclease
MVRIAHCTHDCIIDSYYAFVRSASELIEHRFGRHLRLHGLEWHFASILLAL